ncbi:MAG: PBP1A family penicillin-binding protein [Chloroflexi bacterium]|nr:PBP1A family penicillin-binding protein [Chloroflexota bacterium]MBV9603221.1 PBP1A family penicillin-binding protein [Chloroflexota bacterium]
MRLLLTLLAVVVFLGALGFASVMGLYAYYARDLPDPGTLTNRQLFQTARIVDRNGKLLQEINDPEGGRRTLISLQEIPRVAQQATIAAEDASFYDNPGFDIRAVVRATYQWIRSGSPQSGASTITQQLVKNTLLGPEQTAERKIKEAFLAMELTRRYSKDQILEMYMNEISYGNRAYGIEAAAETYFGKPAKDLTLPEASLLAGLPQAPSFYDPYTNLQAAKERQAYVLDQMVRTGAITPQQQAEAAAAPLNLVPPTQSGPQEAPHFVTYVRQLVEQQFGTEALYREGLQVTTSLDLDLQHLAESKAAAHIADIKARNATNAALVAIQPSTGEVLAMLGSVNFNDARINGQVNVALAQRQPGSTLKPFTYITAFSKGWNPATTVWDIPTTFPGDYRPSDFDEKFPGPMSVRDALAQSRNIPAVETLQFVTVPDMLATAHKFGIEDLREPDRYGLSVTLGGGEVKLLDLTYAYSVFANGGQQIGIPRAPDQLEDGFRQFDPVSILKVTDSSGKVLYDYSNPGSAQVADPRLVYQITSILSDDKARQPTYGANSPLVLPNNRPVAVKTGTTDAFRDSWVVGYTPDLVTGVWVGNTDNTPMKDVMGVAGAGQIWHDFMAGALANTHPTPFNAPQGVQQADVCALSGMLPTQACRENSLPVHGIRRDWFVPGVNLPTQADNWHQSVQVCKVNGKLATPLVPDNARGTLVFVNLPDAVRAWGLAHGYPAPPRDDCSDVYQGEKIAEITSPAATDRIVVGQTLQIVGSAYIDDFASYTLDVGAGDNPTTWTPITDTRTQAVDKALLGVWNTTGLQPGRYRMRLRVVDGFQNAQESQPLIVTLTAPATATPTAAPTSTPTPVATPTRAAVPPAAATPTLAGALTQAPRGATPTAVAPRPTPAPHA